MKLITELNEEVNYLVEEKEGKKNYFIEGIIMQGDKGNKNGRIYPIATLEREMNRFNENYISKNRAYGELGHPSGPTINLERACIMFKNLRREGSNIVGRAKVLDTPMGNIVRSLIDDEANLGISSRGMGSLKQLENGLMEVQDDFYLATPGDIVADPSAPEAFVRGVMEGVEWVWDNGIIKAQKVEEMKNTIKKASKKQLQETQIRLFKEFFNELSKK
jgi:hypothetical protein